MGGVAREPEGVGVGGRGVKSSSTGLICSLRGSNGPSQKTDQMTWL